MYIYIYDACMFCVCVCIYIYIYIYIYALEKTSFLKKTKASFFLSCLEMEVKKTNLSLRLFVALTSPNSHNNLMLVSGFPGTPMANLGNILYPRMH